MQLLRNCIYRLSFCCWRCRFFLSFFDTGIIRQPRKQISHGLLRRYLRLLRLVILCNPLRHGNIILPGLRCQAFPRLYALLRQQVARVAAYISQQVIISNLRCEMSVVCYIALVSRRLRILNAEVAAPHLKIIRIAIVRNTAIAAPLGCRFNADVHVEFGVLTQWQAY